MWDTAIESAGPGPRLSHDPPCQRCGHATHTFLPCREGCDCRVAVRSGHPVRAA